MTYTIVPYDATVLSLLPHPHEPFQVTGRLIRLFDGQRWQVWEALLPEPLEKRYVEVPFEPAAYIAADDRVAFLAVAAGCCVGSIRVCRRWNGNAWIEDLTVNRAHRGRVLGTRLMDAAVAWSREKGLRGVFLETPGLESARLPVLSPVWVPPGGDGPAAVPCL